MYANGGWHYKVVNYFTAQSGEYSQFRNLELRNHVPVLRPEAKTSASNSRRNKETTNAKVTVLESLVPRVMNASWTLANYTVEQSKSHTSIP